MEPKDNLDFHNTVCNRCIHLEVCKLPERIREFDFIKFVNCEHFDTKDKDDSEAYGT